MSTEIYVILSIGFAVVCGLSYMVGYHKGVDKGWSDRSKNLGIGNMPRMENPPPPPKMNKYQ